MLFYRSSASFQSHFSLESNSSPRIILPHCNVWHLGFVILKKITDGKCADNLKYLVIVVIKTYEFHVYAKLFCGGLRLYKTVANPVNAMNSFVFPLRVVFYSRELLTTNKCYIHLLYWLFFGILFFRHSQWTVSKVIGLPAPGLFLTRSFSSEFTKCTTNSLECFTGLRVCSQNPKTF